MSIPFFIDTEVFSTEPIASGTERFVDGGECLIVTYCYLDTPVRAWDCTADPDMPADLRTALDNPDVELVAHNAPFDRAVVTRLLESPTELKRWHCTMARAYAHALPGSLDVLGVVLGLPQDKQKLSDGKSLIQLFCQKTKGKHRATRLTHPAEWKRFLQYAINDTEALREIYKRLPLFNYKGEGRDYWVCSQEQNERGFYIDRQLCESAVKIRDFMKSKNDAEVEAMTNGEITKGTQRERIHVHLIGQCGLMMPDLTKDTIESLLADPSLDDYTRRLLELRRDSSLNSLAKYADALKRVGKDGRIRYSIQAFGAGRTGRNAGRGFQPHNMPRPKREADEVAEIIPLIKDGSLPHKVEDVNQACKDALRGAIIAEPGNELLVGDWSNIEGRVLAWLAREEWKLKAFRERDAGTGPDLYVLLYAKSFGVEIDAVTGKQRQMGKGQELSCGYGGGVGAFLSTSKSYGTDLEELGRVVPGLVPAEIYNKAEKAWKKAFLSGKDHGLEPDVYAACDSLKQIWRRQNTNIVQLWYDTERAIRRAIEYPGSVQFAARCKIWRTPKWLIVELPSKRRLMYAQPTIRNTIEVDEMEEDSEPKMRSTICYMTSKKGSWQKERTYSGKLIENITQAVANDVLRSAQLRLRDQGYPLILDVHDEVVAEAPVGFFSVDDMLREMEVDLWWSDGLPLAAEGYAADRYRKE